MPEQMNSKAQPASASSPAAPVPAANRVRSSSFKYYIHDGVDALRLKLIGDVNAADLPELNGCWRTARTTLGDRKLMLDLGALRAADEAARQWIASMMEAGAGCVPEGYLDAPRNGDGAVPETGNRRRRGSVFATIRDWFGPRRSADPRPTQ